MKVIKDAPGLGPAGMITKVLPDHYADVLVRNKIAEELPKQKRGAVADSPKPAHVSTPPPDVPLTNKELKSRLKALGVKIPFAANKATLIALYHKATGGSDA